MGDVGCVVGEVVPIFRVAGRGSGVVPGGGVVTTVFGGGDGAGAVSLVVRGEATSSVSGLVETRNGSIDGAGEGIVVRPGTPCSVHVF